MQGIRAKMEFKAVPAEYRSVAFSNGYKQTRQSRVMYNEKRRSNWWFLLPILLTIVGGIIAYFVLRHDDPQKARNCLMLGAVLLVIHIALAYVLPG